jgi:hypothetical protein
MKFIIPILVLALIVIAVLIYKRFNKKIKNWPVTSDSEKDSPAMIAEPNGVVSFGYKCIWIAVNTHDRDRVAEILGIKNLIACNWEKGIEKAYENKIFISPSVGIWTLIAGWGLVDFEPKNELDEAKGFKQKIDILSKEFGEAQLFFTHRVTEYHGWAKSINGTTTRYYSFLGERFENILIEGEATPFEKQLNLANTFSEEAKDENYYEREDIVFPDEELVMKIAEVWSVNPTTLEDRTDISKGLGLVGN